MTTVALSLLVTVFGCVITGYLVLIYGNLKDAKMFAIKTSEKIDQHMLDSSVHAAGFVRVEEQIRNLCEMAKMEHERLTRIDQIMSKRP